MKDEPTARRAMRLAGRGARDDASRLVAAVPALIREARRRRAASGFTFPALAAWLLPRLASATAVAVLVAAAVVFAGRSSSSPAETFASETFESAILGASEAADDLLLEAVLEAERNDG